MPGLETYSPEDLKQIERMLTDPKLPSQFESWVKDWVSARLGVMPFEQLIGLPNVIFHIAPPVNDSDSTTSATFVDLAHIGPVLSGFADGRWIFFWGFAGVATGTDTVHQMAVAPSWAGTSDTHVASSPMIVNQEGGAAYAREFGVDGPVVKGSPGLNTLTAKYKRQAGTGTAVFNNRWLMGIRYGEV